MKLSLSNPKAKIDDAMLTADYYCSMAIAGIAVMVMMIIMAYRG